jgi:WD40 repeat protein
MVYPHRLAVTADSKTIVFGSFNQLFLVDVATATVRTLPNEGGSVAIAAHPSRPLAASVNWRGNARIVSLDGTPAQFQADMPAPASGDTDTGGWQIGFSPDGKLLAITGPLRFRLWDWEKNRKLLEFDAKAFHGATQAGKFVRQDGDPASRADAKLFRFVGAVFSPDGSTLALVSSDQITLVRTKDGKQIVRKEMPANRLSWVLFTSARSLAIGQRTGSPFQWSFDSSAPRPASRRPRSTSSATTTDPVGIERSASTAAFSSISEIMVRGFLVTFYKEQWLRILASAPEIETFIRENDSKLKTKE